MRSSLYKYVWIVSNLYMFIVAEDKLHSMSEGDGTLQEFLAGQAKFTLELCRKANDCEIKSVPKSEDDPESDKKIKCPLCKSGYLVKRNGRNGLFWGCSNYPDCRMTCDDKEGNPDLEAAQRKIKKSSTGNQRT